MHPVGPASKIDLVKIESQDFVFGIAAFNLKGQKGLLELAHDTLSGGEEEGFCELLGNSAGPFYELTGPYVLDKGPEDSSHINSGMLVELSVFCRNDRLLEIVRDHMQRHGHPLLGEKLGQQFLICGIDAGDGCGFEGL